MNNVLSVVIILVLVSLIVLVLRNSGEKSQETFKAKVCDFEATGINKIDCLNKCKSNQNCYHYLCEEECGKCEKNNVDCPWDKLNETSGDKIEPIEIKVDTSEGSVKISFETLRLKKYEIDGYLYQLYKTNRKSDGIIMGVFANKNCITCEKVLTGLDPNETYTVSVKPFNKKGIGEESNKINFVPIGKLSVYDFNINTPIEDLFENEYKFCDSN
jgi:hypothetical protein